MFWNSWDSILRILIVGTVTYLSFLVLLRISGKRSLSKLNAFDLIVSVALGSILASTITSSDLPLADGLMSFTILLFLQYVISQLSVRVPGVEKLVKSNPVLLLYEGEFIESALKEERITKRDILSVVRNSGYHYLDEVQAVVLETDGGLSVLPNNEGGEKTALKDVEGI